MEFRKRYCLRCRTLLKPKSKKFFYPKCAVINSKLCENGKVYPIQSAIVDKRRKTKDNEKFNNP